MTADYKKKQAHVRLLIQHYVYDYWYKTTYTITDTTLHLRKLIQYYISTCRTSDKILHVRQLVIVLILHNLLIDCLKIVFSTWYLLFHRYYQLGWYSALSVKQNTRTVVDYRIERKLPPKKLKAMMHNYILSNYTAFIIFVTKINRSNQLEFWRRRKHRQTIFS